MLRFWEAKFNQLKPMKRGGGRRYYRPEDVALLRGIRFLLYNDGYTIRGVQKILRENGPRFVMDYRGMEEDEAEAEPMRVPEIPDVAAEAAKGGGTSIVPQAARPRMALDREKLCALLDEIESCQRVLAAARD